MAVTAQPDMAVAPARSDEPLYSDRRKVYPQRIGGRFRRIKWLALAALLGLYYLAPWLRWDRGPGAPDQALLIDLPGRRAHFFFIEIWPQEVYYLAGLLILGAIGLFLVTALLGRVWCGFACPQTVWTDLFMWVERLIEGDRAKRMRLDQARWTLAKACRKFAKHVAWMLIALATGGAWIFYFNDAPTAMRDIVAGTASGTIYGFIGLFAATTYLLAGWAREQVCIYMCPWPRFQAAMFDEHSLLITYEGWRGEPRAHAKPGSSPEGRGHCIDCGLCVRVCPTGIDIRNGQQLACIGCGLCIDACNNIMAKMGWPGELITYDSLSNQAARGRGEAPRLRFLRPRSAIYAALLLVVVGIMAAALARRTDTELNVIADRAPLFVALSDGSVQNGYTLKILNKARRDRQFSLDVAGPAGATASVIGRSPGENGIVLSVGADSVGTFRVLVRAPRDDGRPESVGISFTVTEIGSDEGSSHDDFFHGPKR